MQMIRTLILSFLFLLYSTKASTQQLKTAELAYRKGHYVVALQNLKAAENKGQEIGEYGQFIRIMSQRALLPPANDRAFYQNIKQFDLLESLRDNCRAYLLFKAQREILSQRRQQVIGVQQSLKEYPVAKVQFDENMHLRNSHKAQPF